MLHLIIGNYYLFNGLKCILLYAEAELTKDFLKNKWERLIIPEFTCEIMFESGKIGKVSSYKLAEILEGEE